MSLYALTAAGLQRINRKTFGVPIPTELQKDANGNMVPVEGGSTTDPGVDELKRELIAGLSETEPVNLEGAFQLKQDSGFPALQIFVSDVGTPVIQLVDYGNNRMVNLFGDGAMQLISNAFTSLGSQAVVTNDTNANYSNGQQPYINNVRPPQILNMIDPLGLHGPATRPFTSGSGDGGGGYTGAVGAVTGCSFAVNVSGCSVTITPTLTIATMNFSNGLLVSVT